MAPEVLRGEAYNHKCDVWAIGCIFYELLTGFAPFTGTSYESLKQNLKKGTYFIPKTIELSLDGLIFLDKCLKYETKDRISWQELVQDSYILCEDYDFIEDQSLMLSRIEDARHSDLVSHNPHAYMKKNKDMVHEINTRDTSNFEIIYRERLIKFQ